MHTMTAKEIQSVQALNHEYQRIYQKKPGTFLEQMSPEAVEVNLAEQTVTIRFRSEAWMRNPISTVHGGVVAAMADIAMAGMGRVLKETHRIGPTIQMNLEYLRSCPLDQNILVKATCHKAGRQFIFLSCIAFAEAAPDKALFTASGCFANVPKEAEQNSNSLTRALDSIE